MILFYEKFDIYFCKIFEFVLRIVKNAENHSKILENFSKNEKDYIEVVHKMTSTKK